MGKEGGERKVGKGRKENESRERKLGKVKVCCDWGSEGGGGEVSGEFEGM